MKKKTFIAPISLKITKNIILEEKYEKVITSTDCTPLQKTTQHISKAKFLRHSK